MVQGEYGLFGPAPPQVALAALAAFGRLGAMTESLNTLESFAIPGIAQIVSGQGGLPKIVITTPAATAEIYLHGAQVTSWKPLEKPSAAEDVLFLSEHSRWEDGKAIRGGIPICWPWFRAKADDAKAPAHGLVRTKTWELTSLVYEGGVVIVTLTTESDEATRKWWPHKFNLVHRISVGAELTLELTTTNTGGTAIQIAEALHTYHRVSNARKIHVSGLDGTSYLDNMDGNSRKQQEGDAVLTKATDNAYLQTAGAVVVVDPGLGRQIRTEKKSSLTTVVWNPWEDGAAALADLGNDEWTRMACAEASNILEAAVSIAPGETHTLTATLSVEPLSK